MAAFATAFALITAAMLVGCSQATAEAQSPIPEVPAISYIGQWGAQGNAPGELDHPTCIATDSFGYVYVADAGTRYVEKFGPDGVPHLSFQDLSLRGPQSIALDSGGAIYVTDASRGTVSIYLPSGIRLRTLRRRLPANQESRLDVSVDAEGLIYLFDSRAHRVFTYTPRFRLVRVWQPSANVPNERVWAVAMTGGPDGSLYFSDPSGNRVVHFTSGGHFLSEFRARPGWKLSDEIAVSKEYVFAMDADGRMLHVWSADGAPKANVDLAPELGQGSHAAPPLAASPRNELLVLDALEGRVLRYRINF